MSSVHPQEAPPSEPPPRHKRIAIIIAVVAVIIVAVIVTIVLVIVLTREKGTNKDNSEESNICGSDGYECSSDGTCIYSGWECDGLPDCSEGEDEDDCGLTCDTDSEFACADHSECITLSARCDQTEDCDDGSDEWSCLTILTIGDEDVLLVNYQGTTLPVCSENWSFGWNNQACEDMGFGDGTSSGEIDASSVSYSSDGYISATSGGSITTQALEVLGTFSSTCSTSSVVTLECTYDAAGTRGRTIDVTTGQARIINGYEAEDGAWPWQIALLLEGNFNCGGSIIDTHWILTAAHCIDENEVASVYSIRAGSNKESGDDTYLQTIVALEFFVHEDYNENTLDNDIALIQLDDELVYDEYVRPVSLPTSGEDLSDRIVCYVSGWGATDHDASEYPTQLQELKTPLVSDTVCNEDLFIDAVGGLTDALMQCAGYLDIDRTICSGDSGGPLVCRDKRNVWTQAGAVSWSVQSGSDSCASIGVFTEVSAFITWISSTMSAADTPAP